MDPSLLSLKGKRDFFCAECQNANHTSVTLHMFSYLFSYLLSSSILHSTLFFLQDEEEDIRNTAAEFAACISEPASSVTCSVAISLVLQYMVEHFFLMPECWVALETITKGQKSTEDVLKVYFRSK